MYRYRKYLELQETWDAKSEGDPLSAYYNDFYHKCVFINSCYREAPKKENWYFLGLFPKTGDPPSS